MIINCIELVFPDNYNVQLSDLINTVTALATLGLAIFALFQINGIKNGNRNIIKTNLTNYETEIVKLNFEIINISEKINDEILKQNVTEILSLYNKQDKYLKELFLMTDSLCFYLESLSKYDDVKKLYFNRVNKIYSEYKSEIKLLHYLNLKKYLYK